MVWLGLTLLASHNKRQHTQDVNPQSELCGTRYMTMPVSPYGLRERKNKLRVGGRGRHKGRRVGLWWDGERDGRGGAHTSRGRMRTFKCCVGDMYTQEFSVVIMLMIVIVFFISLRVVIFLIHCLVS